MLKEKLIKSYLYLHDKESTGWKGGVLQYIKNNIKNILEGQLKKDDVQSVDLLTRSQSTGIENILGEINNISIVDFLQYNQPSKIQVVDKIIKLCTQLGDKIDISILDLSQDIKQTLQQNITDEQVLVSYISQVKDICETLLKTDTATYKKLRMIANKAELFEVLTQTSTELEKDEEVFYTTQRIDEVKKETFGLVYKNCDFIKEADRKVEQSIIIFTYAIKIKNYNRAKNILKKRGDDMQIYRLYRFYELMKEYISFLEKSDDENNKNEVESVIYTMIQDLETHKVDYLQSAYTRIGNQKLHRESIAQFDTLNTILKKLTAFNHMHEFRSTPKDAAVYLAKVDRWPRQVMKYLQAHDFSYTMEDLNAYAKELFDDLDKHNTRNIIHEKKSAEAEKDRFDKKQKRDHIKDTLINKFNFVLNKVAEWFKSLKKLPKMILTAVLMPILLLVMLLKYLISGAKQLGGADGEGGGSNLKNNIFSEFLNDVHSSSIKDLLNGLFSGNLFDMEDKSNNLKHERDLLDRGSDRIKYIDVIHYDKLDSNLLVGEVFFNLLGVKWTKEKIDSKNSHVLEKQSSGFFNDDYSFFLDSNKRSMHILEDDTEYPTLRLPHKSLNAGRNSIVCPRGYIPVLSKKSRLGLANERNDYQLYCIKNLGYYYLDLQQGPHSDIEVHYVRYGDTKYNGIFFNTQNNQGSYGYADIVYRLISQLVSPGELPGDIQKIIEATRKIQEPEEVARYFESTLSSHFKYSKVKRNTVDEYMKYPTYLSGVAHTGVGDCKNVNTLNIALLRNTNIQAQLCAGYVKGEDKFEGHGISEVNFDGKCMLLDATPYNMAPDREEQPGSLKTGLSDAAKQLSLMKEYLSEKLAALQEKYKKWLEREKKINIQQKLSILELQSEKEFKSLLSKLSGNDIEQLIKRYLESLPNKNILKQTLSKNEYEVYLHEYIKRVRYFVEYIEDILHNSDNKDSVVGFFSDALETNTIIDEQCKFINQGVGTNFSRESIQQDLLASGVYQGDQKDLLNNSLIYFVETYQSLQRDDKVMKVFSNLLSIILHKTDDKSFLPIDIYTLSQAQYPILENKEEEKKKHNKKNIASHKVKKIFLQKIGSLYYKVKEHVEQNDLLDDIVRFTILEMLENSKVKLTDIDESVWENRNIDTIKSINKEFEKVRLDKSINIIDALKNISVTFDNNIGINEIVGLTKLGRKSSINSNYDIFNKHIGIDDLTKTKMLLLSDISDGNANNIKTTEYLTLLQKYEADPTIASLIIHLLKHQSNQLIIDAGVKAIYNDQEYNTIVLNAIKKKLLETYKNNPLAIMQVLNASLSTGNERNQYRSMKENNIKINEKDFYLLEQSIEKAGSTQEDILVCKQAITTVINMLLYKPEIKQYRSMWGIQEGGVTKHHLLNMLVAISEEDKYDIRAYIYNKLSQRAKRYNNRDEMASSESFKRLYEEQIYNTIDIIETLLSDIYNYSAQKKKGYKVLILEKRLGKLKDNLYRISYKNTAFSNLY